MFTSMIKREGMFRYLILLIFIFLSISANAFETQRLENGNIDLVVDTPLKIKNVLVFELLTEDKDGLILWRQVTRCDSPVYSTISSVTIDLKKDINDNRAGLDDPVNLSTFQFSEMPQFDSDKVFSKYKSQWCRTLQDTDTKTDIKFAHTSKEIHTFRLGTIKTSGAKTFVWEIVYDNPNNNKNKTEKNLAGEKTYVTARILTELICRDNTYGIKTFVSYKPDGSVAFNKDVPYAEQTNAVPDSIGEAKVKAVCSVSEFSYK